MLKFGLMIVLMNPYAVEEQLSAVFKLVEDSGMRPYLHRGKLRCTIAAAGEKQNHLVEKLAALPGVDEVLPSGAYMLAGRVFKPENTLVSLGGKSIGKGGIFLIAGPCSVENRDQVVEAALAVRAAGANALRGGAFKPRSSPYSFQGLGEKGLELLALAREASGLPVVTEVMSPEDVPLVSRYADVLQVGSRNMQNTPLLSAVGQTTKPVLLKRGMSATLEEFLLAAEYILSRGNNQVILCERGIRTFESTYRNTTDINAVPVLKDLSHLPVFLDPSHSTGNSRYVGAISRAAVAAGADGLIIEVHPDPDNALSDGQQSLRPEEFARLVHEVQAIYNLLHPEAHLLQG
jgi:3-deoxy-7-phosphoheptulonate synthase